MAVAKEWFDTDYYKILGVKENASQKEITQSYRKLAKIYHPDVNSGSEEKFKEINSAYEVLSDPERRKEYDQIRQLSKSGGFRMPRSDDRGSGFRVEDLSDIFSSIFAGNANSTVFRRSRKPSSVKGADLDTDIYITFEEAIKGTTKDVSVPVEVICRACQGLGYPANAKRIVCSACNGTGFSQENKGLFSLSTPCVVCGGKGFVTNEVCKVCGATGKEKILKKITAKIPAGVDNSSRLRIKGKGAPGINGGEPGDLYLRVHVSQDKTFSRKGRDIIVEVPVAISDAVLGGTIEVPTPFGERVKVKVPAGTQPGTLLRVKGRGITSGNKSGDLLVRLNVVIPKSLKKEEKELFEKLRVLTSNVG